METIDYSAAAQPTSGSWREIARELANQTNTKKIAELSEELNRALAEQKGPMLAE